MIERMGVGTLATNACLVLDATHQETAALPKEKPEIVGMFAEEVARVRTSGALGTSGRLVDLFDFLAARGLDTPAARQSDIAKEVFMRGASVMDDATVRVYVHRLRKRIDEYYASVGCGPGGVSLVLPTGSYALTLQSSGSEILELDHIGASRWGVKVPLVLAGIAAALLGWVAAHYVPGKSAAPPVNEIWQPLLDSPRPTLVVLGDYYMFAEVNRVEPHEDRLIRDFQVNSAEELEQMQHVMPDRYRDAQDIGINYLPVSTAYGLTEIVPLLRRNGEPVSVLAASQLKPDMLNYFDVVYVGLLSGMALLENETFVDSTFAIGETYDDLVDLANRNNFKSDEARQQTAPPYYRDYGYISRFHTVSGATVIVVAGTRDTGLRGIAPIASGGNLSEKLAEVAAKPAFEALYEVTGQHGVALSEKLVNAQVRKARQK